jgi:hypothetical protein
VITAVITVNFINFSSTLWSISLSTSHSFIFQPRRDRALN